MKKLFITLFLVINFTIAFGDNRNLGKEYIEEWKNFYPSKALARGMHSAIFSYEDRSVENIEKWLLFNKAMLPHVTEPADSYVSKNKVDARLLRIQILKEIDQWERQRPHETSITHYSTLITRSLTKLLGAEYLNMQEKTKLVCARLESVQQLCSDAVNALTSSSVDEITSSLKRLEKAEEYFQEELPELSDDWLLDGNCENLISKSQAAAKSIAGLITHVNEVILANAKESTPILGSAEYARQLSLYSDSQLTPDKLSEMALQEIELVRGLIEDVSSAYLQSRYPELKLPKENKELIRMAFDDMEKDAPISSADYLEFWTDLNAAAISFIEEQEIATLPEMQTLRIMTAPESAGAAARIGWVASAPPFDPNPLTTLYLPSIPESLPEQERIDFWSSFNKPFNRMIVIHELFPGHYMQIKISRETPHPVRLLFPYSLYIEGWATFCEKIALDAGWQEENTLTLLAHLRKRLENANRTYTSVQVHCNGWDQEKVLQFSTETALVAPQFAKSLWGRLMRSPMQLTSYFLGGSQFRALYQSEQLRLGDDFVLKEFMDFILRSGAIPIDEFPNMFEQNFVKN
jgi:uncharacterized protein (DUF885 family)